MSTERDLKWRQELRNELTPKERTAIPRVKMPELDPAYRIKTQREVCEGLSYEQALLEANRCLDCPNPGCVQGCPVHNDIPGFIKNIARRNFKAAMRVLNRTTVLPAVCGRVCPQEKQCESKCIYNKMDKQPVSIGALERYVADFERNIINYQDPDAAPEQPKEKENRQFFPIKVAVVGSGPSGLAFAGDMCMRGYKVTVFEALSEFGGVLKYGIPQFCLPNEIVDHEIDKLRKMGVEFVKDCFIGHTLTYEDLHHMGYKGIYLATGAGKPRFMGIPGENLPGVLTANEYLIRQNLVGPKIFGNTDNVELRGKRVAVIGGGNTAIDAVRAAVRMGAERAMIVYRRGLEEMPARLEEIRHAREEGVEFLTLCNPIEYRADEKGYLRSMVIQRMELGEPDESGRRSPKPIEGMIEEIDVELVVVSVGYFPNPPALPKGVELTRKGQIIVNDSLESGTPAIYAGGDIVRGPATVIMAMGDGRRAAASMAQAFEKAIENIEL